jgi:hypothetical protein
VCNHPHLLRQLKPLSLLRQKVLLNHHSLWQKLSL